MKLFARLFGGIGIGLAMALLILIGNKSCPVFMCTGQMICGTLTCNADSCNAACESAEKVNNCEDGIPADYTKTTIFSLILCGGIGAIWGIAGTISSAVEKNKLIQMQRKAEEQKKNSKNAENTKKALNGYLQYAENEYQQNLNLSLYSVCYQSDKYKAMVDTASHNCMKEKDKLNNILNSLNI